MLEWDAEYWQKNSPVPLLVRALVHKHTEIEKDSLSFLKEVNSDIPVAATTVASTGIIGALTIAFNDATDNISDVLANIPGIVENISSPDLLPSALTGLSAVIAASIYAQVKTDKQERCELLAIYAEFLNNVHDHPEGRTHAEQVEYAEQIVRRRLDEENIKLANIPPISHEKVNKYLPKLEKLAHEQKLMTRKDLKAADVEKAGRRLKSVGRRWGAQICRTLRSPYKFAQDYTRAIGESLTDWVHPKAIAENIKNGFQTLDAYAFSSTNKTMSAKRRKSRETLKSMIKQIEAEIEKNPELLKNEDPALTKARQYFETAEVIEDYNKKQKLALTGFTLASALMAGQGVELLWNIYDLDLSDMQSWKETYELFTQKNGMFANVLQENKDVIMDAFRANKDTLFSQDEFKKACSALWGIVMGYGAYGATGKITRNFDIALHSKRAEEMTTYEEMTDFTEVYAGIQTKQHRLYKAPTPEQPVILSHRFTPGRLDMSL
ncbi:MAG: hypothetical protein R3E13_01350 [Alphaproteobacteria bacterium]